MGQGFPYTPSVIEALAYPPPGQWMPVTGPNCIRLHAGYPAPELVPVEELRDAAVELFSREHDLPLRYAGSPSFEQLPEQIEIRLTERGIDTQANRTLITAGSAQAINLVLQTMLERNSVVIVERPTYMEVLETLHNFTDCILTVPVDENGLQTEKLEQLLRVRTATGLPGPKLLYTIPSYQNPTGATLSVERRKHLLALADQYNFLIMEDDAYGELSYGAVPPLLKALDKSGRVLHLGSLSKVIAPGLRIGWMSARPELVSTFERFKKDLSHPVTQAMVSVYLSHTDWQARLTDLRAHYRRRRDILLDALAAQLPQGASTTLPGGGYFVWIHLPEVDTAAMLPDALDAGVSYVPGRHFFDLARGGENDLRLSFSHVAETDLEEGVSRLCTVMRRTQTQNH